MFSEDEVCSLVKVIASAAFTIVSSFLIQIIPEQSLSDPWCSSSYSSGSLYAVHSLQPENDLELYSDLSITCFILISLSKFNFFDTSRLDCTLTDQARLCIS
jgi:hypothetical protein